MAGEKQLECPSSLHIVDQLAVAQSFACQASSQRALARTERSRGFDHGQGVRHGGANLAFQLRGVAELTQHTLTKSVSVLTNASETFFVAQRVLAFERDSR